MKPRPETSAGQHKPNADPFTSQNSGKINVALVQLAADIFSVIAKGERQVSQVFCLKKSFALNNKDEPKFILKKWKIFNYQKESLSFKLDFM